MTTTQAPSSTAANPDAGAAAWVRKHLFSSVGNGIQTILFTVVLLGIFRWLLGMIFEESARWSSVWTNMRLLMAYNYPASQFVRIWFSLTVLLAAAALTIAAWGFQPRLRVRSIGQQLAGLGGLSILAGVLAPAEGTAITLLFGVGVVAAVLGAAILVGPLGGEDDATVRPGVSVTAIVAGLLALVWLAPFGRFLFVDNAPVYESGTLSMSTKQPLTIALLVFLGLYWLGSTFLAGDRRLQLLLITFWVVGPAYLIFLVLRDPQFDWAHIWSTDVPMALGFMVVGAALAYVLSDPGRSELARAVGAGLLALAVFNWIAAFFGWYPMLQKARFSFLFLALFILVAPSLAGDKTARLRFAQAWVGLMFVFHWLVTGINTASTVEVASGPFMGGLVLTLGIAYYVMLASFPIGLLMALARTSKMPIFRVLATSYIEFVRGIPLITVLFFFSVMVPLFLPDGMGLAELAAIFVGYTLFSGAYMAENIRGGLQSIRQGQFEASDALGLTTFQRTVFIILPQALRVSIPNLVGQAIATFKETSLIAIVGGFDLLNIANRSIPNQPDFLGQKRPALLFICFVYWVFAYSMSRASRNLETKLGVGTR